MRVRKENQAFDSIDPQVCAQVAENPLCLSGIFTKNELRMLNRFMYFQSTTGSIFFTQRTLALYAGLRSRQYANVFIGKLIKLGIVISNYRHKTSCQYKVSSFFNEFSIRKLLKGILPALAFFPIAAIDRVFEKKWTQYNSIYLNTLKLTNLYNNTSDSNVGARTRKVVSGVKKGEKLDEASLVPDYITTIQNPVMTFKQKMQLAEYSEEIVRYALIQLQRSRDVQSPIGFLLGICKNRVLKVKTSTGKGNKKEVKSVSIPQQAVEVRDEAFWKKDNEELAHWDVIEIGRQVDLFRKEAPFIADVLIEAFKYKLNLAHQSHRTIDCHICATLGESHKLSAKFYLGKSAPLSALELSESQKGNIESKLSPLSIPSAVSQLAGRQLELGGLSAVEPGRNSKSVSKLIGEVEVSSAATKNIEHEDTYIPESTTRIEIGERKPEEWYNESDWEEILS